MRKWRAERSNLEKKQSMGESGKVKGLGTLYNLGGGGLREPGRFPKRAEIVKY